jgi:hypothetical protein
MKYISVFVLLLLVSTFAVMAAGGDDISAAKSGSFVTLKQGDCSEFRAFRCWTSR